MAHPTRKERSSKAWILMTLLLIAGCDSFQSSYTLYRNSVTNENMRIHVATFDSSDGHDYNQGNCRIALELFQKQDGVKTKFWCEKGKYRK
jgi:hypothetical protein